MAGDQVGRDVEASSSRTGRTSREKLLAFSDLERSYTYDFQKTPFDVDNYCAMTPGHAAHGRRRQLRRVVDDVRLRPRPAGALGRLLRHARSSRAASTRSRRTSPDGSEPARELRVAGQAEPISHFTDAVEAGGFLFVSGIVPVDEQRELVGGDDVVAQARCVFENMRAVLAAGGCTFADVVKVTVYLTDVNDRPLVNPVRQEVFGETTARLDARRDLGARDPGCEDRGRVRRARAVMNAGTRTTSLSPSTTPTTPAITWLDEPLRGAAAGPLAGRTLLVKDLIDTAGIRTTYGSRIYADHVPTASRDRRPAGSRRGRDRRREGQPARVRVGRPRREPVVRDGAQPAPSREDDRRLVGRAMRPRSRPGSSTSGSAPTPAARSGCPRPPAAPSA